MTTQSSTSRASKTTAAYRQQQHFSKSICQLDETKSQASSSAAITSLFGLLQEFPER
ncbi:uncharacterized protein K444DRAFT_621887 [Hyaloscypha bicolor E]|uniref:Uncharacterized protein n=1 Tax=Hyaloscypha bicolor E TaxID=1095630 RepID=A0A2J6SIE8_9HELO|nr:uncharacterized protein K444DRAFT_621887 [Hyaloscypha bicolor E]PMD50510.1 hypothetical protein K444DRAFT_621887 [Hyaloscypha bicolor E]